MTKRPLSLLLSLLLLTGCAATSNKAYEGTDYSASQPIRLNMGTVLIDSTYAAPAQYPNVDHEMTPQPQDVLRTAMTQHYRAMRPDVVGAPTLRFEIKDAAVKVTELPQPVGFWNQMTHKGPHFRYDGRLEVGAMAGGPGTRRAGFLHAEATRSLEVGKLSAAERERLVQGMVAQMVDDVIAQIDQQMATNMGSFSYGDGSADFTVMPQRSGRWDHVLNPPPQRAGM